MTTVYSYSENRRMNKGDILRSTARCVQLRRSAVLSSGDYHQTNHIRASDIRTTVYEFPQGNEQRRMRYLYLSVSTVLSTYK